LIFRETVVPGFDPTPFKVDQIFYKSKDGTKIPMFVVARENMKFNGNNPTLLYGYGGFNISMTPSFSVMRLLFSQHMNGIIAIPNIRGGGEYGDEWHKAATLQRRQTAFDDYLAAAEYLIANQYTRSSLLISNGHSNGGLLVAACMNQRPDLFGCVIPQVGVLDMLRFHKFTIGYCWCSDYGSSEDKDKTQFDALCKYSPCHTIKVEPPRPFPAVLLTTADHDDRVVPAHSFKYAALLQYYLGSKPWQRDPLLIRIEMKAGHGGGKPLSKQIEEQADIYAFIAKALRLQWV